MTNNDEQMAALREARHTVFLMLCKLTGADDEDHNETENEVIVADAIMQLFTTTQAEAVREAERAALVGLREAWRLQFVRLPSSQSDSLEVFLDNIIQIAELKDAQLTNTKDAV